MGHKAYPTLADVPEPVDLVYIVLPQAHVDEAIKQCVDAKARSRLHHHRRILRGERTRAAPTRTRLRKIAGQSGLLMAGPNTIGMVNVDCGMMGSFVNFPRWEKGGVSFFTQTGIFTGAVMLHVMSAETQRLPVSKSIDVGNKIDVDEVDFLNFIADDRGDQGESAYISKACANRGCSWKPRARCASIKPIVLLKPGQTKEGARASASHTGSLAADDKILDDGLRQYGIARAEDEADFLNALRALAMLPKPKGKRVGIATTSGALGVISTDLVVQQRP